MTTRSLLIVYPDGFALGWRGATARLMDLAMGLRRHDWTISMLSAKEWISPDQTPQERAFPGKIIRTPFTGAYPRVFDAHRTLRRLYRGTWKMRGAKYYYFQLATGWAARLENWLSGEPSVMERPDLIWAICTSNLNGVLGGRILADRFRCPYVLELQDPPSNADNKLSEDLRPLFAQTLVRSDGVITTTKSYARHLIESYELDPQKVATLYLSFVGPVRPIVPRERTSEDLILLHAGSLYTGDKRNARSLVHALSRLYASRPELRGRVRLQLLGGGKGAADAERLADELGLGRAVESLPEVSPDRADTAMEAADVLIVIKHTDPSYDMQVPGKLFQYLEKGKPILGLMRLSSEAAEILRVAGVRTVFDNNDIEGIAACMARLWDGRREMAQFHRQNLPFINQFSRAEMAARCHTFLCRLTQGGHGCHHGSDQRFVRRHASFE